MHEHECRFDGRCTRALQGGCDYKHSSKQTEWERKLLERAMKAAQAANEDKEGMEQVDNDNKSVSKGSSVLEAIGHSDDADADSQSPSSSTEATSTSSRKGAERSDHNNRGSWQSDRRGNKSDRGDKYRRGDKSSYGSKGGHSNYSRNYGSRGGHSSYSRNYGSKGGHSSYSRNYGSKGGHSNYSHSNGNSHGSRKDHNGKNDRDEREDRSREKRNRDEGKPANRDGKGAQDKRSKDESTTSQTYDKGESDATKRQIQFDEVEDEDRGNHYWAQYTAFKSEVKAAQHELKIKTEALNNLVDERKAADARSNKTDADGLGETQSQKTSETGGARANRKPATGGKKLKVVKRAEARQEGGEEQARRMFNEIRKGKGSESEHKISLIETIAMLANIEKKNEGRLPLALDATLMSLDVGASPTQERDIAALGGSVAGAYEKDPQRIKKAVATIKAARGSPQMDAIIKDAGSVTRVVAYVATGNGANKLFFCDDEGNLSDRHILVSPLGPLIFGNVQEGLGFVCSDSARIKAGGRVKMYVCQIIDTEVVDIDSLRVDDIWSRMTTVLDENGTAKTMRQLGLELAEMFGKCQACASGNCRHRKSQHRTCGFEDRQAPGLELAKAYFEKERVEITTKRKRATTNRGAAHTSLFGCD